MTDITKVAKDDVQRAKWRAEAARIAEELKKVPDFGGLEQIKAAIVFNDQVVQIQLPVDTIKESSEGALAILIFDGVLRMQEDLPAPATPPAEPPKGDDAEAIRKAAEEVREKLAQAPEPCWRRLEPEYKDPCPNNATGGIRLTLYPHESIQKRYGKKPMLRLVLDLPVCSECFPKMTPAQVISDGLAPGQWGEMSKIAQRKCNGILPAKDESVIEHVPFTDPEYMGLRAQIDKARGREAGGRR